MPYAYVQVLHGSHEKGSVMHVVIAIIYIWLHLVGDIRLVGYAKENEGIVEIMYQGIWGTICDDGWDDIDATIVCRELGFFNGTTAIQPLFQFSSGPVWLNQVKCLGNESKLSQCSYNGFGNVGNCSHAQHAAVQCNGVQGIYKYSIIQNFTFKGTFL